MRKTPEAIFFGKQRGTELFALNELSMVSEATRTFHLEDGPRVCQWSTGFLVVTCLYERIIYRTNKCSTKNTLSMMKTRL
jgi:hypothetical protein